MIVIINNYLIEINNNNNNVIIITITIMIIIIIIIIIIIQSIQIAFGPVPTLRLLKGGVPLIESQSIRWHQ